VTTEERALLNDVAEYQGMTVSEFLRICTLDVAKGIRDDVGAQALKSELEETRARRAREGVPSSVELRRRPVVDQAALTSSS